MKPLLITIGLLLSLENGFSQNEDTVFVKIPEHHIDSTSYNTDTVLYRYGNLNKTMLFGTTILPSTQNQRSARGYGLWFDDLSKSDCQSSGEEVYFSKDKINSVINTDSSLIVDINIYDNCCYDFLCDISVDTTGTVNLIYNGYGMSHCACDCCFGLVFHISKASYEEFKPITGIRLSGNKNAYQKLK